MQVFYKGGTAGLPLCPPGTGHFRSVCESRSAGTDMDSDSDGSGIDLHGIRLRAGGRKKRQGDMEIPVSAMDAGSEAARRAMIYGTCRYFRHNIFCWSRGRDSRKEKGAI